MHVIVGQGKSEDDRHSSHSNYGSQTIIDTTSDDDSLASSSTVVHSGHSSRRGGVSNQKRLKGFQQERIKHAEPKRPPKRASKQLPAADREERPFIDWSRQEEENDFSSNGTQDDVNDFGSTYRALSKSNARKRRQTQQPTKTYPTKDETLQVLRTVQLLNVLLKQQKHQALEHARPRGAGINPTKLAVSYEDVLAKVHARKTSQVSAKLSKADTCPCPLKVCSQAD